MFQRLARWGPKEFAILLGQLAISSGLLFFAARKTGAWEVLPGMVSGADPAWVFAGLVVAAVSVALGIVRWWLFLKVQGITPGWRKVARLATIARFVDLFFVGTAGGDTVKSVALSLDYRDRKAAVLFSVFTDRICGLIALLFLAFTCTLTRWDQFAGSAWSRGLFKFSAATLAAAAAALVLGFVLSKSGFRERLVARSGRLGPRLAPVIEGWGRFCRDWKAAGLGVLVSVAIFVTYFATFYCAARALRVDVPFGDIMAVMPIVDVVTMMPVSLSGIGVREAALQELLAQVSGTPGDAAVAISLAGFAFTLTWVLAGGIAVQFGLFKQGSEPPDIAAPPSR